MPRITPIDPYRLIKILSKVEFKPIRQKGSHIILMNEHRTRVVVPVHPGKKLKPSLIRVIMKEVGLFREKYFELLEKDC